MTLICSFHSPHLRFFRNSSVRGYFSSHPHLNTNTHKLKELAAWAAGMCVCVCLYVCLSVRWSCLPLRPEAGLTAGPLPDTCFSIHKQPLSVSPHTYTHKHTYTQANAGYTHPSAFNVFLSLSLHRTATVLDVSAQLDWHKNGWWTCLFVRLLTRCFQFFIWSWIVLTAYLLESVCYAVGSPGIGLLRVGSKPLVWRDVRETPRPAGEQRAGLQTEWGEDPTAPPTLHKAEEAGMFLFFIFVNRSVGGEKRAVGEEGDWVLGDGLVSI